MRRNALVLAIALVGSGVLAADATAQSLLPPSPACLIGGCDEERGKDGGKPSRNSCPLPATLVCAGGSIIGGALGAAGDVAQASIGVAGDAVMGGLTSWVAGGAAWLLQRAAKVLDRSTRPALGSTWFQRQYRTMIGLAVGLSMLFLLCALLQAILRQDPAALVRSALLSLPLSLLLCFVAVTLVEGALAVTDWMTARVLGHFDRDTGEFFADVGEVLVPSSMTGSPLPGFLLFLGGLVTALATFVVWLELVMREAAIYVAVAFLPLCFAAMVWERTAHWCRRLVELLAAIVLAKLTIAVAIALAAGAMGHGRGGQGGLSALMAGCAVMVIAAFTPLLLLRLIPLAEAAGHAALHRGAARAAMATAPGAQTAAMVVRQSVLLAAHPAAGATRALPGVGSGGAAPPRPPPPRSVPQRGPASRSASSDRGARP